MDEKKATSYTSINLHTIKNERKSQRYSHKAWAVFQHPFTRQWVSAYGPFDPSKQPDENGHVGKLRMEHMDNGSSEWAKAHTTHKRNKGYRSCKAVSDYYINIDTGEIIDADEVDTSSRKILRRNAATPESVEVYRSEVRSYNVALEKEKLAKEKVARLTEASVQNWF